MSIFGAMQSGISGLAAQSAAMGSISDNISNVNTVGYKSNSVAFSTLVTKQASSNHYSPGGVQPASRQGISAQGLLAANASNTAIGISGNGYFVVNSAAHPGESDVWAYTRAGDFGVDNNGFLKNTGGFYIQGWSLLPWDGNPNATVVNYNGINYMKAYYDAQGNTVYINDNIVDSRNLQPINLKTIGGTASPTQQLRFGANLPSGDPIFSPSNPDAGGRHSLNALIYDSLGNAGNMNLTFTKQASNVWGMGASVPSGAATTVLTGNRESYADDAPDVYYAAGQLEFSSIPSEGSTITIKDTQTEETFTFVFTKDPESVKDGAGEPANGNHTLAVDLSSNIASSSDVVAKMVEVIKNNMPGANRFSAEGSRVVIEQSVGGGALEIDTSKTLAVLQSSANPDENGIPTGQFVIPAIDDELKNTAIVSFTSTKDTDYKTKKFTINGIEYEFVDGEGDVSGDGQHRKISLKEAKVGDTLSIVKLVELTVAAIRKDLPEPERVSASGTSIEFLPSASGPDIKMKFDEMNGTIKGRGRNGDNGGSFVELKNEITLKSTFTVNGTELESGSLVPGIKFDAKGTPSYFYVDSMSITWANGAQNMTGEAGQGTPIDLGMGSAGTNDGLTSLAGNFNTNYISQDGAKFGSYSGVSIDENGIVTALFDNGETRPIAILPLATFTNPDGMGALTGNVWIETDASGQALLKMADTHGAGEITANSLEQSNVDLATEFSNMIITQRAYSAATKIITTADEMLDELTRMT